MVQLAGDDSDLSALAESVACFDANISHDGQTYILTSGRFDPADDANAVREKAERIVELLNGASRLALDANQSIRVGAVIRHRADGTRDIHMFAEPGVIRFRGMAATQTVTHTDGTVEKFHPADPINQWLPLALSHDPIANVFRILALGTLDWVNLYRILEVIMADAGGLDAIANNGWATRTR